MEVKKQKTAPCTYTLRIDFDTSEVEWAYRKAWREFADITRVPGFRPGKAPRAVLERYIDQERLQQRAMRLLASRGLPDAVAQEKLEPIVDPDIRFGDFAEGQPWGMQATVVVAPAVTLADMSQVEIQRPQLTVTEQDIDNSLEELRKRHAVEQPVQGRGVAEGDIVYVERVIQLDGEEPDEAVRERIRAGRTLPDLDAGLMGQMPGETRSLRVRFPEDFHLTDVAGKDATITVTVLSITREVLPEVTDEWIRQVGAAESVEEFRNIERERLQKALDEAVDQTVRTRAIEELVRRSTVEYPEILLHSEAQSALEDLSQELQQHGITYEQFLESGGLTEEQHIEAVEKEADVRIRTRYVLREFVRSQNIELTPDEIEQATMTGARMVEAGYAPEGTTPTSAARNEMNRTLIRKVGTRLAEMVRVVPSQAEQP